MALRPLARLPILKPEGTIPGGTRGASGLALTSYAEALAIQRDRWARRVRDEVPDAILLFEHRPAVTRGRGLQRPPGGASGDVELAVTSSADAPRAMPFDPQATYWRELGAEYHEIERGGDLTYHGPGQLVFYPIVKLTGEFSDLGAFLRGLEADVGAIVDSVFSPATDLRSVAVPGQSGVWVEGGGKPGRRKIASMGLAVRQGVTLHGIALNVSVDLEPFRRFSPCGFEGSVMTSLAAELPSQDLWAEVLKSLPN